ncbi:MAG: peptide chain release factor N(5)-glutamine methyltransferase [Thermoflexales bacterium]|nr:peptide chain release factor N(5)-glutamine methyltransferase [Thermoflexales bacterium]
MDSPRLAAELLLAHALGVSRTQLLASAALPSSPYPLTQSPCHLVTLSPPHLVTFQSLVDRCVDGEPLAYIIGHKEFYDLDLACDVRALIPRPETELLVQTILDATLETRNLKLLTLIADVGTGGGCIAITLAAHWPAAVVYAVDVSPAALALAQQNAQRCQVAGRITFLRGDLLEPLPEAVDVIAANLPYVTTSEWEGLPAHIRLHEPRMALDGGGDGLELVRRLLAQAPQRLLPGGLVVLEIGAAQGQAVLELARAAFPAARVELKQDYGRLDRLVVIDTLNL